MWVDTWHNMGHTSNLNLSWDKRGIRAKRTQFPNLIDRERERERERERGGGGGVGESQGFLPRSMKFYLSVFVGLRMKVHRIDGGYAWVPERGISPKIQDG